MKELEALEIIRALAEGVNPQTGEIFPDDSPYQNPQTVRALFAAIDSLEITIKRKKKKRNLPERAGKPWADEESRKLINRFDGGVPITEIAREHKRTTRAIESQLLKLGKFSLSPSDQSTPTAAGQ